MQRFITRNYDKRQNLSEREGCISLKVLITHDRFLFKTVACGNFMFLTYLIQENINIYNVQMLLLNNFENS